MTGEELFLAIGQVESIRLARSERMPVDSSNIKQMEESSLKNRKRNPGRILRNLLVAIMILSTLAVTVYAVAGYVIFDNPEDMLMAVFGDNTGHDHSDGSIIPFEDGINVIVEPTFDRVSADKQVVEKEAVPLVSPVGQTISWEGYTLTIDANLYDSVTKCGLLTYTLENPEGLDYSLQSDGEVWFPQGEILYFSQYGYSYIIEEKTTPTKLAATYYYQIRDKENTDLEVGFTQWTAISHDEYVQIFRDIKDRLKKEVSEETVIAYVKALVGDDFVKMEEEFSRESIIEQGYDSMTYEEMGVLEEDMAHSHDKITIPEVASSEMTNATLGGGVVILSPIAITVKVEKIENLPNRSLDMTKILFENGEEYVVKDGYTMNYVFAVTDSDAEEITYMFNRIIDVSKVTSVIVDENIELNMD